ncbi:MAG: PBP1A family penicillin-binding protein, partial [Deltaproteobacteria bacterium]|nr:PBP1A family penicillin-binding protein [Deltaproteobacteria bacterium]
MSKKKNPSNRNKKQPPARRRRSVFTSLILVLFSIFIITAGVGAATLFVLYHYISKDLPSIVSLRDYEPKTVTYFYSDDGRVIGEYSHERRIVVPLEKIPIFVRQAFIAAEDANFYRHKGIDLPSIARAFIKNLEAGRIVQGGSTITQQVTRTFLLTREKTYTRKIKEAILAYRIDQNLSKQETLYLYLNQIYLGHGAYGVESAALSYFNKHVDELSLAQAALIAGLHQAPSRYSPFINPQKARERQRYTLNRMAEVGFITRAEADRTKEEPIILYDKPNVNVSLTPHFTEHVRRVLEKKFGADRLYNDGLKVYTTVSVEAQLQAQDAVTKGLRDLTRRNGYHGVLKKLTPDEAENFLAEQAVGLVVDPLAEGDRIKAVVSKVDRASDSLEIRVGRLGGAINDEELEWALPKGKNAGDVFAKGDLVLTQALSSNPATGRWSFSLEQEPKEQVALLCVDISTGMVKAMIGGRDFRKSQFNRAVQSRRQPGSAFKPIIYTAAMDNGFTPASIIIDSPIVYEDFLHMKKWKPRNYDTRFHGPTMLFTAIEKSRNVITIKLLNRLGMKPAIEYARKMGITSPLNPDLSLALGSSGVSLYELVTAYTVFSRLGERIDPIFITRIEDRYGRVIEEFQPTTEQVISPQTAYVILSLLKRVVSHG